MDDLQTTDEEIARYMNFSMAHRNLWPLDTFDKLRRLKESVGDEAFHLEVMKYMQRSNPSNGL